MVGIAATVVSIFIVSSESNGLGIKENEEYEWVINKVNRTEYPDYQEGDSMIIRIDMIDYFENPKAWVINFHLLSFVEKRGKDQFKFYKYTITANNKTGYGLKIHDFPYSSYYYGHYFIPDEEPAEFLQNYSKSEDSLDAEGKKLIITSGISETNIEFNQKGIFTNFTLKINGNIVLQYQLVTNISFQIDFYLFLYPIMIMGIIIYFKKRMEIINREIS